ncbi:MAG TPA: outer membrane beta-barrel protein [Steroidobacteraceae bacterium]|nr:outer membrane beta-barrel protein [Steroidobacteraceae bacterium]
MPRATILSGLLYAPLPLPLLDLYGKVGLSHLRTDVHASVVCTANGINTACSPNFPFPDFALNESTTKFAYGAGAQLKFSALAVRLEYERISTSGSDPELLSIGVTWKF